MDVGYGRAWRQSLIRDLIKPVQSDEPASALGSHVQEFAFSGDFPSGVQEAVRERGPELVRPRCDLAQWPAVVQQSKIADPKAWFWIPGFS